MLLREKYLRLSKLPKEQQEEYKKDRNFDILKIDMYNYCNIDDVYPDLIDSALLEFYNQMNQAAMEL